ncbi:hypothetical protein L861_14465 [Litchfieldella anticariensis FP35 = DSM 16096]|uniref:DUF4123 domain-containing protein n=1 Tax=Litchfieldella anticariensis (strain DSM 16096 / CECT 5854 / CIP 108499 / LMG 22089 / FP35) TaxID=1121939 RepID=S2KXI4_LITA3|nr:DUF4123 domain-containing protein [Halomonas anticariensis]EPC00129.1 hypothetical protein L861_14465 [Halomonas anticariensis FP35 = DSM 16096]
MSSLPACTHILLDAALPGLRQQWYRRSSYCTGSEALYVGTPFAHLIEVSPLVARTAPDDPFLYWLMAERPTLNWGLLLESPATAGELAAHFRHWLTILDSQGNEVLFRFYDPAVLPNFLDAFDDREYHQWFGPVTTVHCRTDDGFTTRHITARAQQDASPEPLPPPPWWKLNARHQQALQPLYRRELIHDTQQRLLLEAGAWLMHLDAVTISARVADAIDRLTTLNGGALPSRDEAAHFCLLATTSCSHLEHRDDFRRDMAAHGLTTTLARWQVHAYGKLPDRQHHDPAWLPDGPQMAQAPREGTHP